MNKISEKKLLLRACGIAVSALLLLSACGSDDDSSASSSGSSDSSEATMTPGEGVSVTIGRASWSTGYVQAEIYTALMEELGYEVSESGDM